VEILTVNLLTKASARLNTDKNECEIKKNICGLHSVCTNTIGSFKCNCSDGFASKNDDGKNCSGELLCFQQMVNAIACTIELWMHAGGC